MIGFSHMKDGQPCPKTKQTTSKLKFLDYEMGEAGKVKK
jgi:hypothetical protein